MMFQVELFGGPCDGKSVTINAWPSFPESVMVHIYDGKKLEGKIDFDIREEKYILTKNRNGFWVYIWQGLNRERYTAGPARSP